MQAHPALRAETVHGFCWSLLRDFQVALRDLVPGLDGWAERLLPVGDIGNRRVHYELGYPTVNDQQVSLRHADVLTLMVHVLQREKFRQVITSRYPVLLIDEYQDTDAGFVDALKQHFLDTKTGPLDRPLRRPLAEDLWGGLRGGRASGTRSHRQKRQFPVGQLDCLDAQPAPSRPAADGQQPRCDW